MILFLLPTGILYALFDLFTHNDRDIMNTKLYLGILAVAVVICFLIPSISSNWGNG